MIPSIFQQILPFVEHEEIATWCNKYQEKYPFALKMTNHRSTKLGDYRYQKKWRSESHQITVNNNLSKPHFLLTFLHELAHRIVMSEFGARVQPHGKEWKRVFSNLLHEAIEQDFFSEDLKSSILKFAQKPKATFGTDKELYLKLKELDGNDENEVLLSDIAIHELFVFRDITYEKLDIRRTRSLCKRVDNNKKYLIPEMVSVDKFHE